VHDFASPDFRGCGVQLLEDRHKAVQAIVGNADHDETELEFAEVVLCFQPAVNRNEYIKPILSKAEERTVFAGAPSGLGYALYGVARKGSFQAGGNTLI
jgi:hypothetical protein